MKISSENIKCDYKISKAYSKIDKVIKINIEIAYDMLLHSG